MMDNLLARPTSVSAIGSPLPIFGSPAFPIPQPNPEVRDSLAQRLNEALETLYGCHNLVDRLEDTIAGAQPRGANEREKAAPPPNLTTQSADLLEHSRRLRERLGVIVAALA